jgi:hypothetical protein
MANATQNHTMGSPALGESSHPPEATDNPYFQEDQRDGKAASHPRAVLLHLAPKDECERHGGSEHQQAGVDTGRQCE